MGTRRPPASPLLRLIPLDRGDGGGEGFGGRLAGSGVFRTNDDVPIASHRSRRRSRLIPPGGGALLTLRCPPDASGGFSLPPCGSTAADVNEEPKETEKEFPAMMKMESENPERNHVISVLVENEFGVLARIAGMFAARGFNIESLSVGATHDETVSRMTIVVKGTTVQVDQVRKQLSKQLEVIAIQDLTESASFVEREMMLVKVKCTEENRGDLLTVATLFKAEAIDCTTESITLQLVDNSAKLTNFVDFLQPFGIMELARSGVCALNRGVGGLQTSFLQKVRETLDRHQTEIV